jgi:hypothetical protein
MYRWAIHGLLKQEDRLYQVLHSSRLSTKTRERNDEILEAVMEQLVSGSGRYQILRESVVPENLVDIFIEIARARLHVKGKFSRWNRIWLDKYASMYSTPENVGKYRGRRLKDYDIVDIGSGAGMQAVMFSLYTEVTAVERLRERVEMTLLNSQVYDSRQLRCLNLSFPFDINSIRIDRSSLIFSDPLRTGSSGTKEISSLSPNPLEIMKKFSSKTKNFAFDLPPTLKQPEIKMNGELEYISTEGTLSRLTYYSNGISNDPRRAVLLPEEKIFTGDPQKVKFENADKPLSFIYIPDMAIIKADLLHKIDSIDQLRMISEDDRRLVLTSDVDLGGEFPGSKYSVVSVCSEDQIRKNLEEADGGRVFMRFRIGGNDEYYSLKRMLESELHGKIDIYLFKHKMEFILAKKS